jgi:hypothetical protein
LRALLDAGEHRLAVLLDLAFLEKPFSTEGLIAKVREVLAH